MNALQRQSPGGEELLGLIAAVWNGEISSVQRDRLEELLDDDLAAQEFYLTCMALHGRLLWQYRGATEQVRQWAASCNEGLESADRVSDAGIDASPLAPHSSSSSAAASPHSPIIIQAPITPSASFIPSISLGGWLMSYMAATVILGVMLLGAWVYKVSHYHQIVVKPPASSDPGTELVFVGQITGMKDCRWSEPQTETYLGASAPLGRRYALASGLMEITYTSGAKVILEGPCAYEVESRAGGYLSLGKLTARVVSGQWPVASAKQKALNPKSPNLQIPNHSPLSTLHYPLFSVRTPTAIVTDLGTEFGVEVTAEGHTDTQVFQGAVRIAVAGGESGAGQECVCREGESVHIDGEKPVIRPTTTEEKVAKQFIRIMPGPKSVRESNAYAELVLSMQPTVYYRMEPPKTEEDRLTVFDSASGGHSGELRLAGESEQQYRQGRFGGALYFRGPTVRYWNDARPPSVGDYVLVFGYPDAKSGQLSVSAWVMAENRPQWAMIACNSSAASNWYFDFGLHENDGDLSATSSRRYGKRVIVREGASRPFPLHQWQHVAMVCDQSVLRLYRNGVEVASAPSNELVPEPEVQSLSIGSKAENQGAELVPYYCWQGRIDELAIFNRAMSAAEVRQLAGLADRPSGETQGERRAEAGGK